jgi:hypothetical protein
MACETIEGMLVLDRDEVYLDEANHTTMAIFFACVAGRWLIISA